MTQFSRAIARKPAENYAQGLTTVQATTYSYDALLKQHQTYVETLRSLGLEVSVLDPLPGFPDAYFVEDTAIVAPEVAIITKPGAISRQGEEASIADALAVYRPLAYIQSPGMLDGGDVLMVDRHFFIGMSQRTNLDGATQLGQILEQYGYTWTTVPVPSGLHLKSSVNYVGQQTLLLTEELAERPEFKNFSTIIVSKLEEYACNTLYVNDSLIMPAGFPATRQQLETLNSPIIELDMSEVCKMDGGLTCLSLRF